MKQVQTDNSYFNEKVKLRLDNLPPKKEIDVLDMFHGGGLIWNEIQKRSKKKINILGIERRPGMPGVYLPGDNEKYIIDYNQFDIIDLDAYGIPYKQLKQLFSFKVKKIIVFLTFIQSFQGQLPFDFLGELGYPRNMIKKIPSLFNRHGQQKLLNYLSLHNVKNIKIYYDTNRHKNYVCFTYTSC